MLDALRDGERSVGALTAMLGVSQPTVSQHLGILRDAGLVRARKAGRQSLYRLEAARLAEVADWVSRYEEFWRSRLAALEAHLDEAAADPPKGDDA